MKLIWIDDEWQTDDNLIKLKNDVVSKLRTDGIALEIIPLNSVAEALIRIDEGVNDFQLAIVDIEFKNENYLTYKNLFKKLSQKKIYFIIYSNTMPQPNFDYGPYCVDFYRKNTESSALIETVHKYFSCPPFRILHMSDLHYPATEAGIRFWNKLEKQIEFLHNEKQINLFAICGDLAAKDPAVEVASIGNELTKFFKRIKIKDERILVVPGNHDVIWKDFNNNIKSKDPYLAYSQLCNELFTPTTLAAFKGQISRKLPINIDENGLTWHRALPQPQVSIIGICSNVPNADKKGLGILSQDNIEYVRNKWERETKKPNEMRIFLLHHNIFPVLSLHDDDEQKTIINAGQALKVLTKANCDIVLSGHVHRSEIIYYQSSSLDSGFVRNKPLLLIANGTSGGVVPALDFEKSFNIIDVIKDIRNGNRVITITPYRYKSSDNEWRSDNSDSYTIPAVI